MSGIFQGYTNSNGRVRAAVVTKVPSGSANDRGMIVAGNRIVPYLADAGQPRVMHDGIAFDEVTGLLLATTTPFGATNISMGGLLVDSRGAVVLVDGVPQVIHQGVGLQNEGSLSIEAEPIATFIAHLRNDVASTTGPGTFTRASDGLYQGADGNWRIAGPDEPRFEDGQLLMEPAITNKCQNYNVDPDAALFNMTLAGSNVSATLTRKIPSVYPVEFDGIGNGYVFELDNSPGTGSAACNITGITDNTITHTLSIWARVTKGTPLNTQLRTNDGSISVNFSNTEWQRVTVAGAPGTAGNQMQIFIGAADRVTVEFLANQLEELPVPSSPIITQGASASRAADALTYANADQFFNQAQGMALITVKNRFNHGDLPAGDSFFGVLSLQANIESLLRLIVSTGDPIAQTHDSTGAVSRSTFSPPWKIGEDGFLAVLWGPTNLELGFRRQGDGTAEGVWRWATKAYSGAFITDDLLRIAFLPKFPFSYVDLVIYDSNKGQSWVEANYP